MSKTATPSPPSGSYALAFEIVRDASITDEAWAEMGPFERGKALWALTDEAVHGGSILVGVPTAQSRRRVHASRWFPAGPFFGQPAVHKCIEGCILGEVPVPRAAFEAIAVVNPARAGKRARLSNADLHEIVRSLAIERVTQSGEPITEKELRAGVLQRYHAPAREIDKAHAALDPSLRRRRGQRRQKT
jgi:hypothetical protein